MDATLQMMIRALYPDMVEIKHVPSDWVRVVIPVFGDDGTGMFTPGNTGAVPYNFEEVHLEELCEGCDVSAGMSQKTHIVFVRVGGL